jgi:NTE family protein
VVGAIICTHRDADIERFFEPENLVGALGPKDQEDVSLFAPSKRMTKDQIYARIAEFIPDLTFQEAYELTGRHLNISIAPAEQHQTSRLLNAIASPNVYVREAVMASCAVPGVYPPVTLAAKDHRSNRIPYLPNRKWVDGSVTNDLPAKRLARLYGVNHHIVSQANPLVTPFASDVKQQRGAIAAIRNASVATLKAWLNANVAIWQKPLSYFPQVNSATNIALSVINQDYTGDINIIRPPIFWSLSKILSNLPEEDIRFLMDMGERTTWPKIEMVRTQTKISKTLDRILLSYEDELAQDHRKALKRKVA